MRTCGAYSWPSLPLFRWSGCLLWATLHLGLAGSDASLHFETSSLRIAFDDVGGVPLLCELIDPAYQPHDESGSSEPAGGILLIDSAAEDASRRAGIVTGIDDDFFALCRYESRRVVRAGSIELQFTSPVSPSGIVLRKTYFVPPSGFAIRLTLEFTTRDGSALPLESVARWPRILLGPDVGPQTQVEAGISGSMYTFIDVIEASGRDVQSHRLDEQNPVREIEGAGEHIRWVGIHSRYFLAAIAPVPDSTTSIAFAHASATVGEGGPRLEVTLASGGSTAEIFFYVGPKERRALEVAGVDLERILYHGLWIWMRWLCFGLMSILSMLHSVVRSWGGAIMLLAVVVRVVMFPIAQLGLQAQAKVNSDNARIRPHLDRVKEEYKHDAARRHEEMMKVYKEHGVNPYAAFKGCGWLLLQIPIFIGLYNVVGQAYDLQGASFLWVESLALPDRLFSLGFSIPFFGSSFNLLPVLMSVSQVLTSNLAPVAGGDARQQRSQHRTMVGLAVAFFVLFYNFPAGLVLYWTCANLGHLIQQQLVSRRSSSGVAV